MGNADTQAELQADTRVLAFCDPSIAPSEFIHLIGRITPAASCLTGPNGKILAANQNLLELTKPFLSKKEEEQDIFLEELFLAEDLLRLQVVQSFPDKPFSVRLRDHRPVLLHNTPVEMHGFPCRLLIFTEDIRRSNHDRKLSQNLKYERERLFESLRCTLRVYELHEKIRKIPALTRELLQVGKESMLYEEAGNILCDKGMDFETVTFLTVQDNSLVVDFSTQKELKNARFPLEENNRYAEVFRRGGTSIDIWPSGTFILPLRGREHYIGLMEIAISEEARTVFTENHKISVGIYDALLTIADIIALLVENNRLFQQTEQRSQSDSLTGLFNKQYVINETKKEIARADRFHTPLSVLFLDIDNLKTLNDELGHLQVDVILKEFGQILKNYLRKTDCAGRYGGDEFVVLLPGTDLESATRKGSELCHKIEKTIFPGVQANKNNQHITCSCGTAGYDHGMSVKQFLALADEALYKAKKAGKNRAVSAESKI